MSDNTPATRDSTSWSINQAPDFVVIGGPYNDGVMLMASKALTRAEMRTRMVNERTVLQDYYNTTPPIYRVHLVVTMREDYVMIKAPNYSLAWQELFQCWNPEQDNRAGMVQITQRKVELPDGGQATWRAK